MKQKCKVIFIDNKQKVVDAQREYISAVLNRIKELKPEQFTNLHIDSGSNFLTISLDDFEYSLLDRIVKIDKNPRTSTIKTKVTNFYKEFKNSDSDCCILFVVDLCLADDNKTMSSGIAFANELKSKINNNSMDIITCSGIELYNRIASHDGFEVLHRSLSPGDKFSSLTYVLRESENITKLSEISSTIDKPHIMYLLDLLIKNPYLNTQYFGDILSKGLILCKNEDTINGI